MPKGSRAFVLCILAILVGPLCVWGQCFLLYLGIFVAAAHKTTWEYKYDGFSVHGESKADLLVFDSPHITQHLEVQLGDGTRISAATFVGDRIPNFLGAPTTTIREPRLGGTVEHYKPSEITVLTLNGAIDEVRFNDPAVIRNRTNGKSCSRGGPLGRDSWNIGHAELQGASRA